MTPRRRLVLLMAIAAAIAGPLAACGSDPAQESAGATNPPASSAPEGAGAEGDGVVPVTNLAFDELANGRTPDDIVQLLGYYEGGDDPCYDTYGSLHQPTLVRYPGFEEATEVEVGWSTSLCFGDFTELEVRRPDGSLVDPSRYFGSLLVLPGEPTGTYTATAHSPTVSLTAEVEVVPAEHPHLGVPDTQDSPDHAVVYVVGFPGRSSVPVAVYGAGSGGGEADQLVGLIDVPVDDLGQGIIEVTYGTGSPSECLVLVADPSQAVQVDSFDDGDATYLDFGNAFRQSVCSSPT